MFLRLDCTSKTSYDLFFPGIYFFTISNISWLNKYNLYISQTDYLYVVYVQQKLLKQKIFERALFWLS